MSASREKKQRTASTSNGATEKQRRDAAAASRAKAMTVLYTVLGVVIAVAAIILILWNNGIFTKNKVAATIDGHNYTVTELGYYYYPTVNMYRQYGITVDDATAESLRQSALESLHQIAALAAAAEADGYAISQEGKDQVDEAIKQLKGYATQNNTTFTSYIGNAYGRYMNEKTLRSILIRETLAREYSNSHADALTYSEDQINGYYTENAADLDNFTYSAAFINGAAPSTEDADGNEVEATDEEKAAAMSAAKAVAEQLAADAQEGDFDALAAAAAEEDDRSSAIPKTTALGSTLVNSLNADCKTWLAEAGRKSGDITTIELADSGYWVVKFVNRALDDTSWGDVDVRHILIRAELADGATEPTQEAMDAAKAKAQEILDQFNAGSKTAEDFAALAQEHSDDPGSKDNGGLYEHITPSTSFLPAFIEWTFDDTRKVGDTGLVENNQAGQQGWHVMYLDKQNELLWRSTILNALRNSDMEAWVEEIETTYPITANEANLTLVK